MTPSRRSAISRGVDRRAEVDPRTGPLAVEVGGDDERRRRQRIVVGDPRAGAVAQLELPRPAAPGEAVREPDQQRRAGLIRVDGGGVEPHAGPAGDVGGALADPIDGPPVGPVVAQLSAHQGDAQREVGGQPVAATAHDVALLDDGGDRARQGVGSAGHHPGEARVDGEPDHRPAERRDGARRVERAERVQQLVGGPAGLRAAAGRRTAVGRAACPTPPPPARTRPGRPG